MQDLIARIVDSIYTAAEYDEYLLFKYMLIKEINKGHFAPVSIGVGTAGNLDSAAVQFRGISNTLPFMSKKYNEAGVMNTTPRSRQIIFMDAMFNAQYDVEVLASAFNMGKADFMGSLYLIDDWTSFDNDRWTEIRSDSTWVEEVSDTELTIMNNVKAVMVDESWFQVYDNNNKFTEKFVASGDYWNYFYHVWKTVSHSPFANSVVFVTSSATTTLPAAPVITIGTKVESADAVTLTLEYNDTTPSLVPQQVLFVQTDDLVKAGIAITPYGELIIPKAKAATTIALEMMLNDTPYYAQTNITAASAVGATVTFKTTKPSES